MNSPIKQPLLILCLLLLAACTPSSEGNVRGYLATKQIHQTFAPDVPSTGRECRDLSGPTGSISGAVLHSTSPVEGATVLVAERCGRPHSTVSNAGGYYQIDNVPVGQYVVAAVAPGFDEVAIRDDLGIPTLVTVFANIVVDAPLLHLERHQIPRLAPVGSFGLTETARYISTAPFPAGSSARVWAYQFQNKGVTINTLRLYLPNGEATTEPWPLLFMVYPTAVDLWESVSVAFASQGFALVAISPHASRGTDVDAHALDARIALEFAQSGALGGQIDGEQTVALGGSFSSAILNRLLRDTADKIDAWVTVGGIGDAFAGTADFYSGKLAVPPQYELAIPALGLPDIYPLPFLRYSPKYVAEALPATLIIHTNADRVIPISQAHELEAALMAANVPVEVFYYADVSHYLQIDENMTEAGAAMFERILDYTTRMVGR